MPARRDLHTGRLNFMHRSWGPLEPFDNSFAQSMWLAGIHTHLISDHLHYFEDGGATYHNRFRTWDFVRGQEYDAWKAMVQPPVERLRERYAAKHYNFDSSWRYPKDIHDGSWKRIQHAINSEFMIEEKDLPLARCFASGFEFLDINRSADQWFLMLECFDPHEPFQAPARFKEQYQTGWSGGALDWPIYQKTTNSSAEEIAEIRANYAALVAACDHYFGQLLDYFDRHDLWRDTALILSTDHGFLLAEHDWWGKNLQPYYTEISHIPLIIHHPDCASHAGERRDAVTQTMDLMPTFLDLFGLPKPPEVRGRSAVPLLDAGAPHRDIGIFGMFGDRRPLYVLSLSRRPLRARPARIHAHADAFELVVQRRGDEDGRDERAIRFHQRHAGDADRCPEGCSPHSDPRRQALRSRCRHDAVRPRYRSATVEAVP